MDITIRPAVKTCFKCDCNNTRRVDKQNEAADEQFRRCPWQLKQRTPLVSGRALATAE